MDRTISSSKQRSLQGQKLGLLKSRFPLVTTSFLVLVSMLLLTTPPTAVPQQSNPASPAAFQQASQAGLTVETSLWDGGYNGDSFFFYFTLTNNGTSWLNITSVTITLNYGIFKPPGPLGVVPPGQGGGGQGFQIPIPSTTAAGNHTLTLTTSFQSYDNTTSTWLTKTPIAQTATLIVKPFPELDNRPALLAAIATAGLGLFLGPQPFRERRLAEAVSRKPLSMASAISLLLITLLTFYLLGFPSLDYRVVFLIFFPPAAVVVLLAIAAGEANFVRRHYKPAILLPLVLLSLSATLASHVYVGVHGGGSQCGPGILGAGFPLPWDAQTIPYLGPPLPIPFSCPALVFTWSTLTPIYFLLDLTLYAALGIGIVEAYRIVRQQRTGGLASSVERPKGQTSSVQVLAAPSSSR